MTDKNIQMTQRNSDNTAWDNLYPKTKASNVITNSGSDVETQLTQIVQQEIDYGVASGTNTYTATITDTTLIEGKSYKIKFTNANTGASTLNINGLGAKTIQKGNGNALSSGNIKAGQICHLVYTGTVFQLLGEGGEYGTATASDVVIGKTIGTEAGVVEGTYSNIISIQKGMTSITESFIDVTINTVDLNKAFVIISSRAPNSSQPDEQCLLSAQLINSTTLRIQREATGTIATAYWQVVEMNNIKSIQRGSTVMDNVTSTIFSVNAINQSKSILIFSSRTTAGFNSPNYTSVGGRIYSDSMLSFAVALKQASCINYVEWQLIEFN